MQTTRLRVLEAQAAHRERPLEVAIELLVVHAGVDQHEAVAGRERPGVAVRHARPGQRQAQAVDPRQHPFAPSRARAGCVSFWHAAETRLRPFGGVKEAGMAEREKASEASTKVQEVAANMQQAAADAQTHLGQQGRGRRAALLRGDRRARPRRRPCRCGPPGGRDNVRGRVDVDRARGRAGVPRRADRRRPRPAAWRSSRRPPRANAAACSGGCAGTFAGPGTLGGVAPTGSPIDLEGFDLVTVRDGLIAHNDAFTDT